MSVAEFIYVWTTAGFCYVSFITDVFSRRILGWRVMTTTATPLVSSIGDIPPAEFEQLNYALPQGHDEPAAA